MATNVPADVVEWVRRHFDPQNAELALWSLAEAVDHTGAPAGERLVRCAAVGSRGNIDRLLYLVDMLKVDYRDVIVFGEYDVVDRKLIRIHNLIEPVDPDLNWPE